MNLPADNLDPPLAEPSPARSGGSAVPRLVAWLLIAALTGLLALQVWQSRSWPLLQDPPLMHYLGWRMTQGDVPYRDFYDMNFPGTLLLHWGIVKYLGPGDAAWRGFDLAWTGLTMLVIFAYVRRLGWMPGLAGALIFGVLHLDAGPLHSGQRDYLMVAMLIASAHFAARFCEKGGLSFWPLLLAGLLAGAAATFKPMAVLFWAGLGLFAAFAARKNRRCPWAALLTVAAAGLVPVAAAAAWLIAIGALPAFLDILLGYLLPLYGRVGRLPLSNLLDLAFSVRIFLVLLALAAVPYLRLAFSHRLDARRGLLVLGLLYGIIHYVLQGKGWIYHQLPQFSFACLLAVTVREAQPQSQGPAICRWQVSAAMAAVLAAGAFGLWTYSDYPIRDKQEKIPRLMADIRSRIAPGQTVQVLDTTNGGLDALLQLKIRQPTIFIYDFHFYFHGDHPYMKALKGRFMEQLQAGKPRLIVLFKTTWPLRVYERIERFPELANYLRERYTVAVERDDYRLYARRTTD